MENISQMSLIEAAVALMEKKRAPQSIRSLIKEVLEMKGLEDSDSSYATQLYMDITMSSKFVYMGNDEWDLKSRQSLDEYDKDGSAFNNKGDEFDDEPLEEVLEASDLDDDLDDLEDDLDEEDEDLDDLEDEDDLEDDLDDLVDDLEDDLIIDDDLVERYTEEDDFNEDKYNDLMDDYEDMYEE